MKKHLNKTMVEFVKDCRKNKQLDNIRRFWACENYANALSQTPRLGHFIRCDENDVPLEEPKNYESWLRKKLNTPYDADLSKYEQYQEACDRVLFDGFFISENQDTRPTDVKSITNGTVHVFWFNTEKGWFPSFDVKTYEDLIKYNLPLTDNGAKVFGYDKPQ